MDKRTKPRLGNLHSKLPRGAFRLGPLNDPHRQKGFFLIEVLIAFAIFMMVIGAVIPIWMQIQDKEKEYHLHSLALDVLQNEVNAFYATSSENGVNDRDSQRIVAMQNEKFHVEWVLLEENSKAQQSGCGSINEWEVVVAWETSEEKVESIEAQVCQK